MRLLVRRPDEPEAVALLVGLADSERAGVDFEAVEGELCIQRAQPHGQSGLYSSARERVERTVAARLTRRRGGASLCYRDCLIVESE